MAAEESHSSASSGNVVHISLTEEASGRSSASAAVGERKPLQARSPAGAEDLRRFRRRLVFVGALAAAALAACLALAAVVAGGERSDEGVETGGPSPSAPRSLAAEGAASSGRPAAKAPRAKASVDSQDNRGAGAQQACRTAKEGEWCHDEVTWAMMEGLGSNPELYPGLDDESTFEDFQAFFFQRGQGKCSRPCPAAKEEPPKAQAGAPFIARRRRAKDMMHCRRRHASEGSKDLPDGWVCDGCTVGPKPSATPKPTAPLPPYVNHYDGDNPMGVKVDPKRSNNFFLILGDWGKATGVGACQKAVADKMKAYVRKQRAAGKTMLLVGLVGDNFYWAGVSPEAWDKQWEPAYGTNDPKSPLYQVPWLAVAGNHDYGDDDPYAFCPHSRPLSSLGGQDYGSQQFNADRNPTRPLWTSKYWYPDYNYHYSIPEADLEFVLMDTNFENVVKNKGCNAPGFREAFRKCGGTGTVAEHLKRVGESGTELLRKRAKEGTASTTVILQHYPGGCQRDVFNSSVPEGRKNNVLCAYGHVHDQQCDEKDEHGNCRVVLTGGGGGCCGGHVAGFTAVHLTDDGGYIADVESEDVSIPRESCGWSWDR